MLRLILRWVLCGLAGLLALVVLLALGYALYAHLAWRDLPVETLEARYGGSDLAMAEIDGVPIRYRVQGEGTPLVLIHSHYLDMGMWDAWTRVLGGRYRLLRYDLAGHGLTGPDPSGVYTVERDVGLLTGLLDHLGIDRAVVVGSSLGGNIAFTFAARHPERVLALDLINSGGLKRQNSRSGREIPGWADHVMPLIPPAALHHFLRWMVADDAVLEHRELDRFVDFWRRRGNRLAELQRLRQYDTGNPDPVLAAITVPTLIQWGEDNPQLPVALADVFEQKLTAAPRITRKVYPGAGHVLPLERPEASATDLLQFLSDALPEPKP